MIPTLDPPIQTIETYRLDLPEPLSREDALLMQFLTERYEGKECRFQKFSRDGFTTLIYPRTVQGRLPSLGWKDPNEPQHSEA